MPRANNNLIGQSFGRLTVIQRYPENDKHGNSRWDCVCSCTGKIVVVRRMSLVSGDTTSCGCIQSELLKSAKTTHGLSDSPEYAIWKAMKNRCYYLKDTHYANYGGRGIEVCDEWKESFETFYRDMGPRPSPQHTVERKNNDKNYGPQNCMWATRKEQANNRRTNSHYSLRGVTKTLAQWRDELGFNYTLACNRLHRGWTFLEAIEPKPQRYYSYNGVVGSLVRWCELLRLDYEETFFLLKEGRSFASVVEEIPIANEDLALWFSIVP